MKKFHLAEQKVGHELTRHHYQRCLMDFFFSHFIPHHNGDDCREKNGKAHMPESKRSFKHIHLHFNFLPCLLLKLSFMFCARIKNSMHARIKYFSTSTSTFIRGNQIQT
jgi:hypothetical protein